MLNRSFLTIILLLVALAAGCQDNDTALFSQVYESDLGINVAFLQLPAEVQAVLGEPAVTNENQGGTRIMEFYLPRDLIDATAEGALRTDSDTPQLSVTYINGRLYRLFNRWYPEDSSQPFPPFFIEPVPGVKLGNRNSDFIDALGVAIHPVPGTTWRLEHKDGRMLQIEATFTKMPDSADQLCSSLSITLIPSIEERKGEEREKADNWRQNVGL